MDVFDIFDTPTPAVGIRVPAYPMMPELPEEPRERFRALSEYLKLVRNLYEQLKDVEAQFDAEVNALAAAVAPLKKGKGRKKKDVDARTILGDEKYGEVYAKYEAVFKTVLAHRQEETERVKEMLNKTADLIAVSPGDTWTKVDSVWSSTYSTQGWGAHSYARGSADNKALHYEIAGLKTEIRVRWMRDEHPPEDKIWARSELAVYEVWVQASEEDCEIAKYKSGQSLKDWLQWCWDRAINPRVQMPGLPWGLEERLGVTIGSPRLRPSGSNSSGSP